jgi:general secretion pathway protein N
MNAATERRLTMPLAVAVLVLGALLLALLGGLGRGVRWDPPRAVATAAPRQAPARLPPPVPLQRYAEVWEKPLFSPDRKPTARAAGAASNIGDLELTGIIITPTLHMALLRNTSSHDEIRVREGASLPDGSTTLTELRPRSALFDSTSGRVELKLPSGAPIDLPRGEPARSGEVPVVLPSPPDESRGNGSHTGLSGEPDEEPGAGAPDTDEDNDNAGNSMRPPPRRMGLPSTAPPPSSTAGADQTQDARIRQLRDAIQKRRAEQAAPATDEGDR